MTSERLQALLAPAARCPGALLDLLATAGLRLVYQLLTGAVPMDYPGLAFPCESQFSTCQTMAGEAEGEKQQHFIAMTTKTPQKKKKRETDGKTVCYIERRLKSDTRSRKRKLLPISISGQQNFAGNTNSSSNKATQNLPLLFP